MLDPQRQHHEASFSCVRAVKSAGGSSTRAQQKEAFLRLATVLHTIARACMGCVEGNTETEPNPNLKELALRRGPGKQRQASQVCEQSVKG